MNANDADVETVLRRLVHPDDESTHEPSHGHEGSYDVRHPLLREHLDEVILATVLVRTEVNGMSLIRTLRSLFDAEFSPGTVYPHLHDLERRGLVESRAGVRTREYRVADAVRCREEVESAVDDLEQLRRFLTGSLGE